jgi:hypothetical protein
MLSIGALLYVTSGTLGGAQESLHEERATQTLAKLDAEAGSVMVGTSSSRRMTLPEAGPGEYDAVSNSGWMRIATEDWSGSRTTVLNVSLGQVRYETDDTTIAYQGGGVWRTSGTGGKMVSPPDFSYRNSTLSLSVVNVTSDESLSGSIVVSDNGVAKTFSNALPANPISEKKVVVTVKSEFYEGWGEYFEERTASRVGYQPDQNKVNITLVPPPSPITLDSGVVAGQNLTVDGAGQVNGNVSLGGTTASEGAITGTVTENVSGNAAIPNTTSKLIDAKARLEDKPAPPEDTITAGGYYTSSSSVFESPTTFNTTEGDIELFVDDTAKVKQVAGKDQGDPLPSVKVVGNGTASIYINDTFRMKGQPLWGTENSSDQLMIYAENTTRITELHAVLYTDAISIAGSGKMDGLFGALIAPNDVELTGNAEITHEEYLSDEEVVEVQTPYAGLTYLHLTESRVSVTDE